MNILVHRNLLYAACQRSQGVILDKNLSHIAIKAGKENSVTVAAMDRVIAIYNEISCVTHSEGIVFVSGKLFTDVVKELPDGLIYLSSEEGFLKIEAGNQREFKMKLQLIDGLTWREPVFSFSENVANIPSAKLGYVIDQVQHCIQHDSARNYGTVAYMHRTDTSNIRLVGTDGFRLSYSEIEGDFGTSFLNEGVCLSKRTLSEIGKMASEGFENINLAISDDGSTLCASVDSYRIYARLAAVKYPKYQGVLPSANLYPIELTKNLIQAMTKRVMLAAGKTNALQLHFDEKALTLSSRSLGTTESVETLAIDEYRGGETEFSINGKFLNEVFSHTASEKISIQFKNEEHPLVIIPKEEPERCHSLHVLVPIRESAK